MRRALLAENDMPAARTGVGIEDDKIGGGLEMMTVKFDEAPREWVCCL